MTEIKQTLDSQFKLSAEELSFLFILLEAEPVPGFDNEKLLPPSAEKREARWLQGRDQLIKNGWLHHDNEEGGESYTINEQLLQFTLSLINPRFIVFTTWQGEDGIKRGVTHYVCEPFIIEHARIDQQYHFALLEKVEVMTNRLGNQLGFHSKSEREGRIQFELSDREVAQIRETPDIDRLTDLGISAETATAYIDSIKSQLNRGRIQILSKSPQKIEPVDLIGFETGMTSGWLAHSIDGHRIRFEAATLDSFKSYLTGNLMPATL